MNSAAQTGRTHGSSDKPCGINQILDSTEPSTHGDMVLAVIDGSNNDDRDRVAAVLIITLRYRNNLFHGVKWQYMLAGQLENFTNASSALMKVFDRHGALEEG